MILALYPNSIGMGYACLKVPERIYDFGVAKVSPLTNRKLLKRAEKFMDYHRPKIILLREVQSSHNSNRVDKLISAIETLAGEKDLPVFKYSRDQVREVFEVFGCNSKYEMAEKIISMLPDVSCRRPKVHKWYEKEDYNMGLFNAISLAITHVHLAENQIVTL
ncbi:MAG: hypothetical protein JSS76_16350 [Bacteroidetes bacterium]|nr:hypothetical protein [Bacteroidota bacterium]